MCGYGPHLCVCDRDEEKTIRCYSCVVYPNLITTRCCRKRILRIRTAMSVHNRKVFFKFISATHTTCMRYRCCRRDILATVVVVICMCLFWRAVCYNIDSSHSCIQFSLCIDQISNRFW